jgi:hypothetical protein
VYQPRDESELADALASGTLDETAVFDLKRELPTAKVKNADVAVDVAAMSTAGGVLIYGVIEGKKGEPHALHPIPLAGARERIDQIVQTSVSEVPYIEITELPSADDPAAGYIIVHVPRSPRAPHMVIVKGENRYYGRGPTGNRLLGEQEIALLYQQRAGYEVDREELLEREALRYRSQERDDDLAWLYCYIRPVTAATDVFAALGGQTDQEKTLRDWHTDARAFGSLDLLPYDIRAAGYFYANGADGWRIADERADEAPDGRPRNLNKNALLDIDHDGTLHLFCGRAGQTTDKGMWLFETVIVSNLAATLGLAGRIYRENGYHGQVDVGVSIEGIFGACSEALLRGYGFRDNGFRQPHYRPTARYPAQALAAEPRALTLDLLRRLLEVVSPKGYDPFAKNR